MKQNNPGCNCCEGGDCERDCWYGCANGTRPCPDPCGIKISMPTPDDVGTADGPTCPPAECSITAKCNACLDIFDTLFRISGGFQNVGYGVETSGNCDSYTITITPYYQGSLFSIADCWISTNYNCPYDSDFIEQCGSEYYLTDFKIIWNVARVDGCAVTTITIKYTVVEKCNSLAVPPNPPTDPATTYEHVFQKTHCDCEDVIGSIPFDSTTATNNSRGITVPDVCNADSATVTLEDNCGVCRCFDCGDEDISIAIEASGFTGTVAFTFDGNSEGLNACLYIAEIVSDCWTYSLKAKLFVTCEPCERYSLRLEITTIGTFLGLEVPVYCGTLKDIACGEGGTFTSEPDCSYQNICGFKNATVSLSSL